MKKQIPFIIIFTLIYMLQSCKTSEEYLNLPTFTSETTINCVIEIPAGTSKKLELNKKTNTFVAEILNGKERIKPYLPLPGNYGFVPSTFSDREKGGDGDPIDVMVICESLPTGTVIETIPIAMLRLLDKGEMDDKVICIPKDKNLRTIDAETFAEITTKYPKALEIIELWFQYSDPKDTTIINGWVDEKETVKEIKRLQGFYEALKK